MFPIPATTPWSSSADLTRSPGWRRSPAASDAASNAGPERFGTHPGQQWVHRARPTARTTTIRPNLRWSLKTSRDPSSRSRTTRVAEVSSDRLRRSARRGSRSELPGHAQVDQDGDAPLQVEPSTLPRRHGPVTGRPRTTVGSTPRPVRLLAQRRPDGHHRPPGQERVELAPDRLDLGEFGHGPSLSGPGRRSGVGGQEGGDAVLGPADDGDPVGHEHRALEHLGVGGQDLGHLFGCLRHRRR